MNIQSLYQEFSSIAEIEDIDGTIMVHTEGDYAVGIKIENNVCKFIDGNIVSSQELHKQLGV